MTRYGESHLNADSLGRCLPKEGHSEAEVEEEDEPKVFSVLARASPMPEKGGNQIQLSKVATCLLTKCDDDKWYCDIIATLRRKTTSEPIVRFKRFSCTLAGGSLLRLDKDGIDKVCVTSGDVDWVLSTTYGTRASEHFGVEATLGRLRLLFWWPSMQKFCHLLGKELQALPKERPLSAYGTG